MHLNDVRHQLKTYRTTLAEINQNRTAWEKSKLLISNTLVNMIQELEMNAEVEKEEKTEGLEFVYLKFGSRESGIAARSGKAKRDFMKDGGYLYYTQLYNGKISVWISTPVIENFTECPPIKPFKIYAPAELKEADIIQDVAIFLKVMTNWEVNSIEHHKMSYKHAIKLTRVNEEDQ